MIPPGLVTRNISCTAGDGTPFSREDHGIVSEEGAVLIREADPFADKVQGGGGFGAGLFRA